MSLREDGNMKVHGLIEQNAQDIITCFAEDAYYTINTTTGRWVKIPVDSRMPKGTIITKEEYAQIVKAAHGSEGDVDLDPAKEIKD